MGYRRREERGEKASGEKEFHGVHHEGSGRFCACFLGWGEERMPFTLGQLLESCLHRRVSVSWSFGVQGLESESHRESLKAGG